MALEAALGFIAIAVVAITDTLLSLRVLRAYRRSGRAAHLVIVLGIASSFVAVVGVALVLAVAGEPELAGTRVLPAARWLSFVGAALAYGLVGVFAAVAFGGRLHRLGATLGAALLVAVAIVSVLATGPAVATPATLPWTLRAPFVALSLAGSGYGAFAALRLARLYEHARRAGRAIDRAALARMRWMGGGFSAMAASQLAMMGLAPEGRFLTPLGLAVAAAVLLGALVFVLACVATWATPGWLRERWVRA